MNNSPVRDSSSETSSHPIDININNKLPAAKSAALIPSGTLDSMNLIAFHFMFLRCVGEIPPLFVLELKCPLSRVTSEIVTSNPINQSRNTMGDHSAWRWI
jgi:hypothetical protein